ncbi:uroporphyrinogen-III synthase [Enterovirga aerilata]|uniref:Uroporphyrinogen-III synthase n=1 Tax=Enterovirga aerilata TaxID=2730920 RepID=A0A849I2D4_9HYPH|nr:uroporphyrinogen-III synthase [Enterovirga sp. DB1703]NNM73976.1 uroporphyrinogen-III synthase [Enterovirga sp. DB1703]
MLVLVTRPRDQGEATARRLALMGHDALLAPVLDVVPVTEAPPEGRFDAVLVTSANALPALAGERDRFAGAAIVAVGRRTAERARAAGFGNVAEAGGDSRALVDFVLGTTPRGARLLHAAGRDRKPEPGGSLAAAGYDVATWACYEARPAAGLPVPAAEALRDGRVDAVLHYSRRSAELFARLARHAGLGEAIAGTHHVCMSADVAAGLASLAGLKLLIAPKPDETALLRLLAKVGAGPGSRPPQSEC